MKTILQLALFGTWLSLLGCQDNRPSSEAEDRTIVPMPTNMSQLAHSVLLDLTGCFLASEPFLPQKATEALPLRQYEVVQIPPDGIGQAAYTLFLDCTNGLFWVLKIDGAPPLGELYGPGQVKHQ